MTRRYSHREAIEIVKEAGIEREGEEGGRFVLWLLDHMVLDDEGVTLWLPDIVKFGRARTH